MLSEIKGMPLVIFDYNLSRSPGGLMHFLIQVNPISLQRVCRGRGIVRFEVEMEVIPVIHELDRGVLLVCEFQMKYLTSRPDACVKVLVMELERQSDLGSVDVYGCGQIRSTKL